MRVTQHSPITWRDRTLEALAADLNLAGRAQRLYQQLTQSDGIFDRLRAVSQRVLTRIHKGRAAGQTPSAVERTLEEMTAIAVAGAPVHLCYLTAVTLRGVADDLTARGEVSEQALLESIAMSDAIEAAEQQAETAMLTRADRRLTVAALEELEERTLLSIAADHRKVALLARLRRTLQARVLPPAPHLPARALRRGGVA